MRYEYFRPSNAESNQTLFGIAFIVMVTVFIGIDVISSRYSTTAGYYVQNYDSEDTNASVRDAFDYLHSSNGSINESSNETNIDSDANKPGSNVDQTDVDKTKTEIEQIDANKTEFIDRTDADKTETNVDKSDADKFETAIDKTGVEPPETTIDRNANKTETAVNRADAKKTDTIDRAEKTNIEINSAKVNNTMREGVETDPTIKNVTSEIFAEIGSIQKSTANIFFVESRCATGKSAKSYQESRSLVLNARQSCAVESTARAHPERPVYVFHSCPLADDFVAISAPFVGRLVNYENVRVVRLLPDEVFRGTPVEPLFERGALEASAYPVEHTSDLLRLALLWRFGGTYCDLDVVTIKPLSPLGANWAGMQDGGTIANGVLAVAPAGEARRLLGEALAVVNGRYDPRGWSSNGPELLTALVLQHCGVKSVTEAMTHCRMDFAVLSSPFLYPLHYTQFGDLFDERLGPSLVTSLKRVAFSVHVWNKMSHASVATVGSQQAYSLLAQEFCPEVYGSCGEHF